MIVEYLQRYINVVQWDINQIVRMANEAQNAYNNKYGSQSLTPVTPTPTQTPYVVQQTQNTGSLGTPTNLPVATPAPGSFISTVPTNADKFHERHAPEFARCAVPLAMVLTSSAEFFGTLLNSTNIWDNGNKFDTAIKNFFNYATSTLTQNQVDLYRAIYRNGLMHGFFPQGSDVAINYDSSFQTNPNLFFMDRGDVVLNVNRLQLVVESVFTKIISDTAVHQNISDRLQEYNNYVQAKTSTAINTFKASTPAS